MQSQDVGVAYIYCNYKIQSDQSTTNLLSAILKQLVQKRPSIADPVTQLYDQHSNSGTRPSLEDILSALNSVLANYLKAYIIVDALDECTDRDGTRSQFLTKLRNLQSTTDLNLMVTSRFIPDTMDRFQDSLLLEVRASDADVKKFVSGQKDIMPQCIQNSDELQSFVQDKIVEQQTACQ